MSTGLKKCASANLSAAKLHDHDDCADVAAVCGERPVNAG
jgi:hypothetical protein